MSSITPPGSPPGGPRDGKRDAAAQALARARALLELGRPQAGAREVRAALAQHPHDAEALQLYGLCLLRAEDHAGARDALRDAVGADPTEAHAHYLLGYAERECERPREAEASYREALRLCPEEPVYLRALAELLATERRFPEALELGRRAVAVAPERASNHVTLGFVASSSGDRRLARRCYEEALRLDPNDAVAWNNLGCVDLAQGRPLQARERFREALRLNPEGQLARENLKLVEAPTRPPEMYRAWEAFERQAAVEICDQVLLRPAQHPRPAQKDAPAPELGLLALLLATEGRALPVAAARARRLLWLLGLGALPALRLLRAGPLGVAALVGSGAAGYLLSRRRVAGEAERYRALLGRARAEFDSLQARWLHGGLSRRERDGAIDRLLDQLCHALETREGAPA